MGGGRGWSGLCWDWRAGLNWGWLCGLGGLWRLAATGLKAGQYLLNEFGARGRQGSVRRRGGLLGLGLRRGGRRLRLGGGGRSLTPKGVSYRLRLG